ncbi:MAG: hypothetical protein WC802_03050 [Patescibacteria group bacterium]|jgi:hypothetical protein
MKKQTTETALDALQNSQNAIMQELRDFRKETREALSIHEHILHTVSQTTVETREIVDQLVGRQPIARRAYSR